MTGNVINFLSDQIPFSRCRLDDRQYLAVFATSEVDKVRNLRSSPTSEIHQICLSRSLWNIIED